MPEIVTCPVCGCKVQMPEGMFGRRVRCFGCDERFLATPDSAVPEIPAVPAHPRPVPVPPSSGDPDPRGTTYEGAADDEADRGGPFCPGCGRPVPWQARCCPHCGEEFEDGGRDRTPTTRHRFRRDALPHRGAWLTTLGNVTLAAGALSLCLFGVTALVGIPLGVAVLVMAQTDLAQMRAGVLDSHGRQLTETARASAITGLILSLLFAAGYAAVFLTTL